jgi:DNA-binding MarR family transcriptional regulator
LIGRAYRLSRQRTAQAIRPHGVTEAQFSILMSLAEEPGLTGIELADRTSVTPQAAHAAVTALERKGLVQRESGAARRRVVRTVLSDEGTRVLDACVEAVRDLGVGLAQGLTRRDRRTLMALLDDYVTANEPPPEST